MFTQHAKPWVAYLATHKPVVVMHSEILGQRCIFVIPVSWDGEAGRIGVQGCLCFHTALEDSLGSMITSQTNQSREGPEIFWDSPHPFSSA